jgi:hypothetical protein
MKTTTTYLMRCLDSSVWRERQRSAEILQHIEWYHRIAPPAYTPMAFRHGAILRTHFSELKCQCHIYGARLIRPPRTLWNIWPADTADTAARAALLHLAATEAAQP